MREKWRERRRVGKRCEMMKEKKEYERQEAKKREKKKYLSKKDSQSTHILSRGAERQPFHERVRQVIEPQSLRSADKHITDLRWISRLRGSVTLLSGRGVCFIGDRSLLCGSTSEKRESARERESATVRRKDFRLKVKCKSEGMLVGCTEMEKKGGVWRYSLGFLPFRRRLLRGGRLRCGLTWRQQREGGDNLRERMNGEKEREREREREGMGEKV